MLLLTFSDFCLGRFDSGLKCVWVLEYFQDFYENSLVIFLA